MCGQDPRCLIGGGCLACTIGFSTLQLGTDTRPVATAFVQAGVRTLGILAISNHRILAVGICTLAHLNEALEQL